VSHLPLLWKFRVLRGIRGKGVSENRRLLAAWATAEGGTARYNPMNTTEPWTGATDYNSVGVKNYPSGSAGIAATVATLLNGHYSGIVNDLRDGALKAEMIVQRNAAEFDVWGTGSANILRVLASQST
jgi:hypothetical protein